MIIRSDPLVSDLRRIVLRLCDFHADMSFLGCTGHVINAPLSIQRDKSNRNHNAAVATLPPDDLSDVVNDTPDVDEARVVYEKLVDGTVTVSVEYICRSDVLSKTKLCLHKHAESTKMSSRTVPVWVRYMCMIDIRRKYIRAERTRN